MNAEYENSDGPARDDVLVAEYVLGVLDADEHARMAARIAAEPELKRLAAFWQSRFSQMDDGFEEVAAPAGTFGAIETRLFGEQKRVGALSALWNSLALWRGIAVGGVAAAAIAVGLYAFQPPPVTPEQFATQLVAALEAEGSAVRVLALYDERTGAVRLATLAGDPVDGRDYELWYIQPEENPVSLGVVPVSDRYEVELTDAQRGIIGAGTVFAITLEPLGGAPEGKPTGPVVAAGEATVI